MIISRAQLQDIQNQLEAVTSQSFKFRVLENSSNNFLCLWENDTQISYLLSIDAPDYRTRRISLGLKKYQSIDTKLSCELPKLDCERLLSDPRRLIRLWLGQESYISS